MVALLAMPTSAIAYPQVRPVTHAHAPRLLASVAPAAPQGRRWWARARPHSGCGIALRGAAKRHARVRLAAGSTIAEPISEAEVPVDDNTIAFGALFLLIICFAVRDEVLLKDVTFEQGALAISVPAACAFKAPRGQDSLDSPFWAVTALRGCAVFAILGFFLQRVIGIPLVDVKVGSPFAPFLAAASVLALASATFPIPTLPIPQAGKLPIWQFGVMVLAVVSNVPDLRNTFGLSLAQYQDINNALGLFIGRVDGWALVWAGCMSIASTTTLVVWSRYYAKGQHGPVQALLAPVLSPATVLPLAIVNASLEEVEFRMMLQGSLLAGPAAGDESWVAVAVILQATYFAVQHYRVGFPSGKTGFGLVFVWALFLGFLRWWTAGFGLVIMLHIQADVVIFALVMIEEEKRKATALKKAPFSFFS